MKYAAITSMNQAYYDRCVHIMLSTFKKHWSHLIKLHVYNEDNFSLNDDTFIEMGWDLGKEYNNFQERWKNNRVKTFAKKGFSIIHAMDNIDADRIIWIDADTVIKQPFDLAVFENITQDKFLSSHLQVWHSKNDKDYYSCETGFFVLNKQHKGYKEFCDTYKDIYYNDKIEGMRRFYDGEIYGKTVQKMHSRGFKMYNMTYGDKVKTPVPRSPLAPFIDHYKAGLKDRVDYELVQ